MTAVFDGHHDLLPQLWRAAPEARMALWLQGDGKGHEDLPWTRRGGFAGGIFAVYVPRPGGYRCHDRMTVARCDLPMAVPGRAGRSTGWAGPRSAPSIGARQFFAHGKLTEINSKLLGI